MHHPGVGKFGNPPALGAGNRWFKSSRLDHFFGALVIAAARELCILTGTVRIRYAPPNFDAGRMGIQEGLISLPSSVRL